MLEGLTDVAWAELEHAYGSAADVPDLIRALRAADPEVRKKARWHLYGNIFHQGTRYEASAYAAPFLLELLADRATPERAEILGLLTSLAIGYDESWLPDPFPVASYRRRAVGGEQLLQAAPTPTGDEDDDSSYRYFESLDEQQQEQMSRTSSSLSLTRSAPAFPCIAPRWLTRIRTCGSRPRICWPGSVRTPPPALAR